MGAHNKYDVLILGGGLAGLTLALQLKIARADLSILILEKRSEDAPAGTHKVGESTVELGSYYLREVLQLKTYLEEQQLPKLGFRFFLSSEQRNDIARRVEVGSKIRHPIPAHQIDRGLFENELLAQLTRLGVEVIQGALVREVDLTANGHRIGFEQGGVTYEKIGKWIIDASGRRSLLKRKLQLDKAIDHPVNAVWFRLGLDIDIDDWSEDQIWRNQLKPGYRRLATNHLLGKGYWIWIIPLVSGNTSIGIVADPAFHPFDRINSLEKAGQWLAEQEPLVAKILELHRESVLDFKVMKHFAHGTRQFYSAQGWGLSGDAGAFLDPFYSPGTDFIALGNTWITDLILRDAAGENIALRSKIYEHTHRELLNGWTLLYQNMYGLFGNTQVMLMKIVWDWGTYWGIPSLMFVNNGYTDLKMLKRYAAPAVGVGHRFAQLNERMQKLFLDWGRQEARVIADRHINIFDLDCVYQFHRGLEERLTGEALSERLRINLGILEQVAAETFRLASAQVGHTPLNMKVDPYRMDLSLGRAEILEMSRSDQALGVDPAIRKDLSKVWLVPIKNRAHEYTG